MLAKTRAVCVPTPEKLDRGNRKGLVPTTWNVWRKRYCEYNDEHDIVELQHYAKLLYTWKCWFIINLALKTGWNESLGFTGPCHYITSFNSKVARKTQSAYNERKKKGCALLGSCYSVQDCACTLIIPVGEHNGSGLCKNKEVYVNFCRSLCMSLAYQLNSS